MLARALRLILLAELSVYAGMALFHLRDARWDALEVVALMCVLWFGLRAVLVVLTFVLSWAWRSPVPPPPKLGILPMAGMMVQEYLAFIALFSLIQPFERWLMGPDRAHPPRAGQRPVVLLVHGYLCNRGLYWWLRKELERAGYCAATVTLEPVLGPIESCVAALHCRIEELCRTTGVGQLVIVAHSMGGLVARAYLRQHGAARLERVITMATPHQGSRMARLGIGKNAFEMQPGSSWLRALNRDASARLGVTAMGSHHDNFVIPYANQFLPHGDNRNLAPIGHLTQAFSRRVLLALLREIENSPTETAALARHGERYPDR